MSLPLHWCDVNYIAKMASTTIMFKSVMAYLAGLFDTRLENSRRSIACGSIKSNFVLGSIAVHSPLSKCLTATSAECASVTRSNRLRCKPKHLPSVSNPAWPTRNDRTFVPCHNCVAHPVVVHLIAIHGAGGRS
jgi:hypothetical protein